MVVRDSRRKGEVAPAEFYCSLEEGVPERAYFIDKMHLKNLFQKSLLFLTRAISITGTSVAEPPHF
jgi:hypothetical protein